MQLRARINPPDAAPSTANDNTMPDGIPLLEAACAAFAVAAVLFLGGTLAMRRRPRLVPALGCLALALGFVAGCWVLSARPRWSLAEDRDRFLLLVVPSAVAGECLVRILALRPVLELLVRLAVAMAVAPWLLYNSVYFHHSPVQTAALVAGLGLAVFANALALDLAYRRAPSRIIPLGLAGLSTAAGPAVMLTGYLSGGLWGLVLAAALGGCVAASLLGLASTHGSRDGLSGTIMLSVISFSSLLIMGRYFGSLPNVPWAMLFAAPLLLAAPAFTPLARRGWALASARLALAAAAAALALAVIHFSKTSDTDNNPAAGPSRDDYGNFGR